MKTLNQANPKPLTPKSILLIGPPGGGKTTLALQFPSVGVVDVDRNLDGPVKRLLSLDPNFSIKYDSAYLDTSGQPLPIDQIWKRAVAITDDTLKDPSIQTLVFDGLTMADDALYEHCLRVQGQSEMRIQDWVSFRAEMIRVIMKCRSVQKTFIMVCHEEPQLDLKGNITRYVPSFRSKVSNFFGGFFTDMWRCTCVPCQTDKLHPQGVKFCLHTSPTALSELKNSMLMPSLIEDITYEKIKPYLV